MVKSTILVLAGLGVIGTGGPVVAPQALEISTGAVTTEITSDGIVTRASETPKLGITWITQSDKQITIRF